MGGDADPRGWRGSVEDSRRGRALAGGARSGAHGRQGSGVVATWRRGRNIAISREQERLSGLLVIEASRVTTVGRLLHGMEKDGLDVIETVVEHMPQAATKRNWPTSLIARKSRRPLRARCRPIGGSRALAAEYSAAFFVLASRPLDYM